MATAQDLITTALRELGVVDVTAAAPEASLSTLALGLLNRILDDWNAERGAVYANVHAPLLTLSAGVNPHTIGVSGATWIVSGHRPVSIEGIRLTVDGGETFLEPLTPRDAAWFHNLAAPGAQSDYPTDFWYDPTWPNGSIFFYPEPGSSAGQADLWYRIVLAQVVLTTDLSFPPGYASALTETLKERLTELPMFMSVASQAIKDAARMARGTAFANNRPVPPLYTDSGLQPRQTAYDWHLGPFSLMERS